MYLKGRIFVLEGLGIRRQKTVLAHELVHHYSRVYGLGFSEQDVIAATTNAGFPLPAYAMLSGR